MILISRQLWAQFFELVREINSRLARNELSRPAANAVLAAIHEMDKVLAILPEKKKKNFRPR